MSPAVTLSWCGRIIVPSVQKCDLIFSDEELDADATGGITADILKSRDDDESSLPKEVSHESLLVRHIFL